MELMLTIVALVLQAVSFAIAIIIGHRLKLRSFFFLLGVVVLNIAQRALAIWTAIEPPTAMVALLSGFILPFFESAFYLTAFSLLWIELEPIHRRRIKSNASDTSGPAECPPRDGR